MTITKTATFDKALKSIKDARAKAKILVRIDRLAAGNPGDVKEVGEGISEMRITEGAGYRVYYTQIGEEIVLLLTVGSKDTQQKDIKAAKTLKDEYTKE